MARITEVTSVANPQVKAIAALAMKKVRAESGLFVVEGLQLVGFGVEAGWELETLVFRKGSEHTVLDKALRAAKYALEVNAAVLEKLTRKENPQGVVGVFRQQVKALHEVKVEGLWVVLEEVRDPGNLGTIIRTADAVGAMGVMLVGNCTDVWAPETVRATMGSIFHVPVVGCSREAFLTWKKGYKGRMVGTHLRGKNDYREIEHDRPLLVCMGTEQSGLSDEMSAACDTLVKIPMLGRAESLNLAVATAVMLYEVQREAL